MSDLTLSGESSASYIAKPQTAILLSVLLHTLALAALIYFFEGPSPVRDPPLKLKLEGITILEPEVSEELIDEIVTTIEPEEVETLELESDEPIEEELVTPAIPDVAPIIAIESEEAEESLSIDVPVAILVHPDSLMEFVRADSEYTRVPDYKSFEEQLRQESYFNSWAEKVTRYGVRAIPASTSRKALHGEITLNVVLGMDGTLEHLEIIDDTHQRFLNNLALSIVRMASPFAPVPHRLLGRDGKLRFQPKIVFRNKLAWVE